MWDVEDRGREVTVPLHGDQPSGTVSDCNTTCVCVCTWDWTALYGKMYMYGNVNVHVCRLVDIIIISLLQDDGQQLEQETPQDVKERDRQDAENIVSTCT